MEYINSKKRITDFEELFNVENYPKINSNDKLQLSCLDSLSTILSKSAKSKKKRKTHLQLCKNRLTKAMSLLPDSNYNISEIAFMCGFNDPKYFSTCFKNEFGMSPKQFRLNHIKNYDNDHCTNNSLVQRAINIIEANLSEPYISAEMFASHMHMSKSTLYRKINKSTGLSPCDFIRSIRISKAMQMMERSEKNIAEVAFAVGFNDTKYFCKCFKIFQGITPRHYKTRTELLQRVKSF